MNGGSLSHVSDHEWREHRRRIARAIAFYRTWCREMGLPWRMAGDEAKADSANDTAGT